MRLQSDERLAELAVDGHEAAFVAIVDRYRGPLVRYSAGIVGAGRADDAVQQTFISAHDALRQTSEIHHLRSWLYRIARNASLNLLRAVRDDVPLDAGHVAAPTDEPAAAFEQTERLRATLDAVRDLPERQRAALVLRELEGRSHEEIAAALGVTMGSARQHLMRARIAVRGAVTAITPYPLVAKLAAVIAGPGPGPWVDAAVGAGAGATVAKLTAGVMATTAVVGGAVGTEHAVHHRHHRTATAEAVARTVHHTTKSATPTVPAVDAGTHHRAPAGITDNKVHHDKPEPQRPVQPASPPDHVHHHRPAEAHPPAPKATVDDHRENIDDRDAGRPSPAAHPGLSTGDHHPGARDHPGFGTAAASHITRDAATHHRHRHDDHRGPGGNGHPRVEAQDASGAPTGADHGAPEQRHDAGGHPTADDRHSDPPPHPDPAPRHSDAIPPSPDDAPPNGGGGGGRNTTKGQPGPGDRSPADPSHDH
ncbi:MAG TPA: sigma-70 family RNA polymerase sigma factor [Baekduia sp.]|jgi:RNA polymerase sigma factor (sigma-70 family)